MVGNTEIFTTYQAGLTLTSHQKFFELVNFWKNYADFSKKRFLDITWVKIVLQSSTKKQNHRKALPDHFRLVSTSVPRFNFTKNLKKQKKFFYQKKFFFSKMLENLKQHRGPLGTYCGKFFFNSSKPFRRYGFPPCTQLFESRTVYE